MEKTKYHSWCSGGLAKGCALCVKGRKLVLFITGLCGQRCFYCPVNEKKFGKDVVYANEWQVCDIKKPVELVKEAELTGAKGAGITGGDPLVNVDRCCDYIKLLKKKFGKKFHIHLYTPLLLVTKGKLKKLYDAGLDEIRFHPNLDDPSLWDKLEIAKEFKWDVGVEIPVVPGKEEKVESLIDYIHDKVDFLNLNELELSDTKVGHYDLKGFEPKDDISYGVLGSEKIGKKLLKYAEKKGLRCHVCTAKLKDSVQMKSRVELRAHHVALKFDKVTKDGLLLRGVGYLPGLEPGFDYKKRIKKASKGAIKRLQSLNKKISIESVVDGKKLRILLSPSKVKKHFKELKELGLIPAVVEEYPTADGFETEVDFL